MLDLIERLDEFDIANFISPNAVAKAMSLISTRRTLPAKLKIVAVGQGTAKELGNFGVTGVVVPALRFDSEALLDLPLLRQVNGKRVVIFRGDRGRELLAENLRKRGAVLDTRNATAALRNWDAPFAARVTLQDEGNYQNQQRGAPNYTKWSVKPAKHGLRKRRCLFLMCASPKWREISDSLMSF